MTNANAPAFPNGGQDIGLTKREYIAIKAMQGFLASGTPPNVSGEMTVAQYWAGLSYAMADSMLKAGAE